jgi:hypothetical protein
MPKSKVYCQYIVLEPHKWSSPSFLEMELSGIQLRDGECLPNNLQWPHGATEME